MCRRNCVPRPAPSLAPSIKPGNVGDDEADLVRRIAHYHDAKVRLQRSERVVGDLGTRGRNARDQRALASVGKAHQPDIRQQFQLQPKRALFAGEAVLVLARGLMNRGREARIAATTSSAMGNNNALVGVRKVVHEFAREFRRRQSSRREPSGRRSRPRCRFCSILLRVVRARPLYSGLKRKCTSVLWRSLDSMMTSPPCAAVAPGRASAWHKFLAAEGHAAIAAVAGLYSNSGFINEHGNTVVSVSVGCQLPVSATVRPIQRRCAGKEKGLGVTRPEYLSDGRGVQHRMSR